MNLTRALRTILAGTGACLMLVGPGQTAPGADDFEAGLQRPVANASNAPADDFEAALSKVPAPAARPQASASTGGRGGSTRKVAPAGLLPPEWRNVRSFDQDSFRKAGEQAREGQLDPFAFVEALFGKIPLPQGFTPARCMSRHDDMFFTSGRSVSAAYDRAKADYDAHGSQVGKPSYLMNRDRMAQAAQGAFVKEVEAFYLARGYRRTPDPSRIGRILLVPANAAPGALTVQLELRHNADTEQVFCNSVGVSIPTGPIVRLRLRPAGETLTRNLG